MSNRELQAAIDALMGYAYSSSTAFIQDALRKLVAEQVRRAQESE